MDKIEIKPLSINEARKWRRFKTKDYERYEQFVHLLLPKTYDIQQWKLEIYLKFWMSNVNADVDNPVKPFVDILQKKYWFNDKIVYKMIIEKEKVKKGEEFIELSTEAIVLWAEWTTEFLVEAAKQLKENTHE